MLDTNYLFPFEAERRAQKLFGKLAEQVEIVSAWGCGHCTVALINSSRGLQVHSWQDYGGSMDKTVNSGLQTPEHAMSVYMSEVGRLTERIQRLEQQESASERADG